MDIGRGFIHSSRYGSRKYIDYNDAYYDTFDHYEKTHNQCVVLEGRGWFSPNIMRVLWI